jgi:hypothetical protein
MTRHIECLIGTVDEMMQKEARQSFYYLTSCLLSSERAPLSETSLSTGWLAQNGRASGADDYGLCVGEDGGDGEAARALDIHEEGSGSWDKGLKLVLACLRRWGWVEKIDCENHLDDLRSRLLIALV